MAIAKIKKVEIIGLEKDKEELLALLQKLGMVELISIQAQDSGMSAFAGYAQTNLLEIAEAISYLANFRAKKGLLRSMVKFKPQVFERQLQEVITGFDYRNILQELAQLRNQLKHIFQLKEKLIQERQLLWPWQNLRISLAELHDKRHCGIILGILNSRDHPRLLEDLEKNKTNLFIDVVHQDRTNMYLAIIYLQDEFEPLEGILKKYHFNFVTLSRHQGRVKDRILEINRETSASDGQTQEIKNKIAALSENQFKLMVIYDYLENIRAAKEADKNLAKQQYTFVLNGWIRQKDGKKIEQAISGKFKDVAIFISEPGPQEKVPVILENKRLIQPFEFITAIYGMPKYNELDPTPFLAPFFFLYFGFCVSDVGYGFLLVLFSFFALKKFRMGPQGKRFFKLFLFCGISTIIVGALTGSWFGNLFDLLAENNKIFLPLKEFKDALIILDPFKEPTKLLGVALFFGIIQVWFGNIVAAIGNIKNRRYLDVLLDQASILTLLFGLTGLGLIFLQLLDNSRINLFKYSTLIGAVALIFTQGRGEKGRGAQLFYGAYNLYNSLSGYLSDILSYSRLWALGLVTGVMAMTINLISLQFSQIIPSAIPFINKVSFIKAVLSSLILIMVFTVGHLISFLMNLLGAFVHPLRLQFVEFFSKFFKSGGSAFKPLRVETKYIDLSEGTTYGTK